MHPPLMVRPELLARDLSKSTIVITGASSGIGLATAEQLARQGATVVMGCEHAEAGERVAAAIRSRVPGARLDVISLDLAELASVQAFAAEVTARHPRLQGLVNNAAVMKIPHGVTCDGFENQFGINHLGHFVLTNLLLDALRAGAPARIVNLTSAAHEATPGRKTVIHFDDLNCQHRLYDAWEAYGQSKLANVLHARELARRLAGSGVTAVSVNPGFVRTGLVALPGPRWLQRLLVVPLLRMAGMLEPWEGAQTSLHALLAPEVEQTPGAYFSQVSRHQDKAASRGGWPMRSPNPLTHDDAVAQRLWQASEALVRDVMAPV